MKRLFVILACLIGSSYAFAAGSAAEQKTNESILEELRGIRSVQDSIKEIHDSTYRQRMRAFKAKDESESKKTPSEYSMLSLIEQHTKENRLLDDWNIYGALALIVSVLGVIYAWKQWKSQSDTQVNTKTSAELNKETEKFIKETEKHTQKAPLSAQRGALADLPRHFYRNIVCTTAIICKYKDAKNGSSGKRERYPSESNLLKLQTLPDDILLPIDTDEKSYKEMHELKLLFRNYNIEVRVASDHLSKQHLTDESLKEDFDNLLFKPFHLTNKAFEYEILLSPELKNQNERAAVLTIIKEHFTKFYKNVETLLKDEQKEYLKNTLDPKDFNYIKKTIDEKEALERSMRGLKEIEVEKSEIKSCCKGKDEKETAKLKEFVTAVTSDSKTFKNWLLDADAFKKLLADKKITNNDIDELCNGLSKYIGYFKDNNGTLKFKELFYYMLAVDAAIETDRIGMINYQS